MNLSLQFLWFSAFDSMSRMLKMRDADSNIESFKCRNFNVNVDLGGEVVGRKDVLKFEDLQLDLSFPEK